MKNWHRAAGGLAALAFGLAVQAQTSTLQRPLDQPQLPPGAGPSSSTIAAWQARKFGMFIHFGLYSVAGGMWNGKHIDNGYSEQILANGPIPADDYAALAKQFDPQHFDADAIAALAKAAGMRYIVITAKHHDGFNLFQTALTPYNSVDGTPYHRDIVKLLAAACARAGLGFGVYYSNIDWHHPGGNTYIEGNSNPLTAAQADFNIAQLKELLGHYGPIAEIWFDMGKPTPAQSKAFAATVHALQPQTMISGRVWNYQGDFAVMGDNAEPSVAMELPWQSPASMFPDTWGYRSWEARGDAQANIRENITRLVRVVSQGGNYILNIGPEGDGSAVPFEAQVLHGMGDWLKRNGVAIYNTQRQPFDRLDFGYATVGAHMLYLFVDKPPTDGVLRLPGMADTVTSSATLVGANTQGINARVDGHDLLLPAKALLEAGGGDQPSGFMPVIAVPLKGPLRVRLPSITADQHGHYQLDARTARHYLNYNGEGYEAPATPYKMAWRVDAQADRYTLQLHYQPGEKAMQINAWVDGHPYPLTLPAHQDTASVQVKRDRKIEPYSMSVEVTPPAPFYQGTALGVQIERIEVSEGG